MGVLLVIMGVLVGISPVLIPGLDRFDYPITSPVFIISFILMLIGGLKINRSIKNLTSDRFPTYSDYHIKPSSKRSSYNENEHFIYYNLYLKNKHK